MLNHADSTAVDDAVEYPPAESIDSDTLKIRRFLLWIESQGATFPSMSIKVTRGTRQVHATRPLLAGELVAHIPRTLTITPDVAKASKTGKLIARHGSNIDDYDYLAAYLLQMKREGGFWQPYIDILPKDYSAHPLFFSQHELDALKGSYILGPILSRLARHACRYDQLPPCLKENGLTREEFTWARCVVSTRVHGVKVEGRRVLAMVPLSDMFNHSANNNADWTVAPDGDFFVMAEYAVAAGSPLFEKYGKRCNARLLEDYGFCLEDNPYNVAEIRLQPIPADHPFFEHAKQLGKNQWNRQVFHVMSACDDDAAKSMFSYLRLACFDGAPHLLRQGIDLNQLPPISRQNEIAALTTLESACESRLQQFPTSVEEDDALLADGALGCNLRNVVMIRRHEKIILKYFLGLAQTALPLLQDPSRDIGKHAAGGRYAGYFADLVRSPAG
jgi:histone-lysine N-methyltransferase SETD3